jgi:hypothetical protein
MTDMKKLTLYAVDEATAARIARHALNPKAGGWQSMCEVLENGKVGTIAGPDYVAGIRKAHDTLGDLLAAEENDDAG